jgi:hypothetical protein
MALYVATGKEEKETQAVIFKDFSAFAYSCQKQPQLSKD